jgi:outer membrane protein assembly factor BamB
MAEEKTYLELSEGNAHKFYEVTVNGKNVAIRFGRIGDPGQTKTSDYSDEDKAKAEAQKKINEKLKKGYEHAVAGVRAKRTVTRRSSLLDQSAPLPKRTNQPPVKNAPVLWNFNSGTSAYGIFVSDSVCWVGNEEGKAFALDHNGQVQAKFKLPEGVKCIVADDDWLYAGCDDGNVYDLSGKVPRLAYEIAEDVDIYWLDIKDGILAVSDARGAITTINHEDESQWTKQSKGDAGWMVRCDEIGIYHGHSKGVTMYDWEDGRQIWDKSIDGSVLFGWQEESTVYACTNRHKIHSFTKTGEVGTVYQCDAPLFSCATSEDGKYVFAGDNQNNIYCFNQEGERLWKLATNCGIALSMQFHKNHLYIVTRHGSLACIDASEAAIKSAQEGIVPTAISIKAPSIEEQLSLTAVETTTNVNGGIVLECFKDGGKLRVRVISDGFNQDWYCQFPKNIREEGARYVADEVRPATRGNFYRIFGDIKRLK